MYEYEKEYSDIEITCIVCGGCPNIKECRDPEKINENYHRFEACEHYVFENYR